MKNQHTPGPWEADIRIAQATVVDSHGNAVADIARHEFSVTEQSYSDQKIEANAHLIAAAPDLLSAARNAANVLAALATGQIAAIKPDSNALKELRSAIAKAEGVK